MSYFKWSLDSLSPSFMFYVDISLFFYCCVGGTHLQPLYVIFGFLADKINSLQHVCDVIDPPLRHLQHFGGPVQVQDTVCWLTEQPHELLSEQAERGVVACSLTWRLRCCVIKRRIIYLFICSTDLYRYQSLSHSLLGLESLAEGVFPFPLGVRKSGR